MIPGQKPEESADVVSRVFKIKLDKLLRDLVQGRHFGRVLAGKPSNSISRHLYHMIYKKLYIIRILYICHATIYTIEF